MSSFGFTNALWKFGRAFASGDVLAKVIAAAKRSLGLHDNYEAAQALLVDQRPQLDGTIVDEITGHSAGALGCRASTFSGAEQIAGTFSAGVAGSDDTDFSAFIWFQGNGSTIAGLHIFDNLNLSSGWKIRTDATGVKIFVTDGSLAYQSDSLATTLADIQAGGWNCAGFVYDHSESVIRLYLNGVKSTEQPCVGFTANASNTFSIGATIADADRFHGQIQYPMAWGSYALTDHEIAMLADSMTLPSTDPDFLGYLIGDKCYDLTGNLATVTGTATITEYQDRDVPAAPFDLDSAGRTGALALDGSGDYLQGGGSDRSIYWEASTNRKLTVSCWLDSDKSGSANIIADDASFRGIRLNHNSNPQSVIIQTNSPETITLAGSDSIPLDTFFDLSVEQNSDDEVTVKIDGQTVGTGVGPSGGFYFDRIGMSTNNPFQGYLNNLVFSVDGVIENRLDLTENTLDSITGLSWELAGDAQLVNLPKLINSDSDVEGGTLTASGRAKKQAKLERGPCVELHGAEYGTITNTDDFSASDWTLSGYVETDNITGTHPLFSQGGLAGGNWLRLSADEWRTSLGAGHVFTTISPSEGQYYFELFHDVSENELTLTTRNLETDIEVSETASITIVSNTDDLLLSSWNGQRLDGKLWGFKLDHANGFELPMQETTGLISHDVSGNGKNAVWTSTITRPNAAEEYFWNQNKGYSDTAWSFGDNSGNDMFWGDLGADSQFDYDGAKLYRVRFEGVQVTAGIGTVFLGFMGFDDSGNFVNVTGADTHSAQHYFVEVNAFPTDPTDYVGYVQGHAGTGTSGASPDITSPASMHTNVTKVRPMMLVNYNDRLGTALIQRIIIDEVDTDGSVIANVASYQPSDNISWVNYEAGLDVSDIGIAKSDRLIPALEDGTADALGGTITSPAGPYLLDDGSTISHTTTDLSENAAWLDDMWQGWAEFDGVSSKIELPNLLSTDRDFEIRFQFKADVWTSNQTLFCCNNSSNNRIGIVSHGGNIRVFVYDGTLALKASENATLGEEHEIYVKYKASTYELISATLDGIEMSGVASASVNPSVGSFLGVNSTGTVWGSVGFYEGYIRNLSIIDDGTTVIDMPLAKNCLDLSGNANHGTPTDVTFSRLLYDPNWVGAEFDGTTSYISLGDDDRFSFGDGVTDSPFSVEATIKADSIGAGKSGIVSKATATTADNTEWVFNLSNTGKVQWYLYDNTGGVNISATADAALNTGQEYQILCTYDGSGLDTGLKIYVDGVEVAATGATNGLYTAMHATATPVEIGMSYRISSARYFDGTIKNVRLYDTECTPTSKAGLIFDLPLLENSDDVHGNFNGTDTAITYSEVNVVDHYFDDTKASPQSIGDNNNKLISFEI